MLPLYFMLLAGIYAFEVYSMGVWLPTDHVWLTLITFAVHTLVTVWVLFIDPLDSKARVAYIRWASAYVVTGVIFALTLF